MLPSLLPANSKWIVLGLAVSISGYSAAPRKVSCEAIYAEVSDSEIQTREKWFEQSLAKNFERSLKMRKAWHTYSSQALAPGEHFVWIQQSRLKELNEKLWDIGGTEFYLYSLDDLLSEHLEKNPHFGTLVHRNYKDRVIVTKLSNAEFQTKVLEPIQEKLAEQVVNLRYGMDPKALPFWQYYIRNSTHIGSGPNLETAFLDVKLNPLKLDFNHWNKIVSKIRGHLKNVVAEKNMNWEKLLIDAKELKNDPVQLEERLQKLGLEKIKVPTLLRYLELMNVVDFLPIPQSPAPSEINKINQVLINKNTEQMEELSRLAIAHKLTHGTWDYSRSLFLAEAQDAKYILATDIRGLGNRALLARDKWIAQGSKISELRNVYSKTTVELQKQYEEIENEIGKILGKKVHIPQYISGDDGLWALPNLSSSEFRQLIEYLRSNTRLYSHIELIPPGDISQGLADAIFRSRRALFDSKKL